MKKISLKNVKETLTRKEMRAISGGYSCAVTMSNADGETLVLYGSLSYIQSAGGGYGGVNQWCCQSCATASWINSCNIC